MPRKSARRRLLRRPQDGWEQADAQEPPEESAPATSEWDFAEPESSTSEVSDGADGGTNSLAAEPSKESPEALEEDGEADQLSSDSDNESSGLASEWESPLLEPKSADWLVEQSQPVEEGLGKIVQPDAWSSFVSGSDDDKSESLESGEAPDDEIEPEERAWGT